MYPQYDQYGRIIQPQQQNPYGGNSPMIDRNYYNRIRGQQQPDMYQQSNPYTQPNPYQRNPVLPAQPYGQPNPYQQPNPYPPQNPSIIDYNACYNQSNVQSNTFSIPDVVVTDIQPTQQEKCVSASTQTIEEVIKSLKQQGYKPLPGSEKIPIYDESRFKPDIVVRGKQYEIILVSI